MVSPGRGLLALGLLLPAALAGCGGGGGSSGGGAATTGTQSITSLDRPAVTLTAPAERTIVRGRATGSAPAPVSLLVAGRAAPDSTVLISLSCADRACKQFTQTDERGAFAERLRPALGGSPKRLSVTADYADADSAKARARATVRVRIERRPEPKIEIEPPDDVSTEPNPTQPQPIPEVEPVPTTPLPSGSTGRRRLIVIGDSLAVGMTRYLRPALPGWRVAVDGRVGRGLDEGMDVLADTPIASPARTALAFSLFTNDDPRSTDALERAIERSLARAGRRGCVIWATIARPPLNGVPYTAANRVIAGAAADDERVRVVDWEAYVAENPQVVAKDGIHPTAAGYRERAAMYAAAAGSCP